MAKFEWTEYGVTRQKMYGTIAGFGQVDRATEKAARKVERRAIENLAEQHHHIRIVPEHDVHRIEFEKGGGKYPVASYNIYLAGENPVALEYGHVPSGKFAGTPTKSPAGTYILHRAADLPGKLTHPRMGIQARKAREGR